MRIELEVKSATPQYIDTLKSKTGMGKIRIMRLALAIGLVELSKRESIKNIKSQSKLSLDLGRVDPTHVIEISAYEILFRYARKQNPDGFYIASNRDLVKILSPALDLGCEELMNSRKQDLIHFIVERFWPQGIGK